VSSACFLPLRQARFGNRKLLRIMILPNEIAICPDSGTIAHAMAYDGSGAEMGFLSLI